ncbi:hypothetical protein [Nocardia carnea]|uniref:hypothetical protein n=1 Tax=Nocardia carnea TaxID=37328 RepID=UPI0024551BF7|nr:hypothetical protein [Nocardia carnea]
MTPGESVPAVSYLRVDLSGEGLELDEHRMRRLSIRFGYHLRELIRTDASHSHRLVTLEDRIRLHRAEAVFIPSVNHLDGQLSRIVAQADVIEQNGETYARWSPIMDMLGDLLFGRLASQRCETGRNPHGLEVGSTQKLWPPE